MHLLLCTDRNYAQHCAALLDSVLTQCREPGRLTFWLITNHASLAECTRLKEFATERGAAMELIAVDDARVPEPPAGSHCSKAALFRILAPTLLPESVERVLYLDCDLLLCRDVLELDRPDALGGSPLAAVPNAGGNRSEVLGLPATAPYFNSGVLLIDLKSWRRERISERAIDYLAAHPGELFHYDQDVLNLLFHGKWERLAPYWNQQYEHFLNAPSDTGLSAAEVRQLKRAPAIVHFSGAAKPWHYRDDHPYRALYFKHLDRGPYAGWRPRPSGLKDRLRRLARLLTPYRLRIPLHGLLGGGS